MEFEKVMKFGRFLSYQEKPMGGQKTAPPPHIALWQVKLVSLNETPKFPVWSIYICVTFNARLSKN